MRDVLNYNTFSWAFTYHYVWTCKHCGFKNIKDNGIRLACSRCHISHSPSNIQSQIREETQNEFGKRI